MASNCCILAKSHAPTQECVRIASGDVSLKATLHLPWHVRAVVLLLHAGDVRTEHINAMVSQQLLLAKIGTLTLELPLSPAAPDLAFVEHCLEGGMQWLANREETRALPAGIVWMDADARGAPPQGRQFVRAALFHNGRVNLANQAEIYRAGISHLLIAPEAGREGVCDEMHGGSGCQKCADEAPVAVSALSESAATAQLAMQIGFWFADHLNCLNDRPERSICPAGMARFARKCWAISGVSDDSAQIPSHAPGKVRLQPL